MNCEALRLGPVADGRVPCAIRLRAPQNVNQIATHFILLCDVSESMNDENKLNNIKKCAELVVGVLTDQDSMSLITFGDSATLHFNKVKADESNKAIMCSALKGLRCDGCTNLSAGLGYVREVCVGSDQKTGLLILTDGHANRGIYEPSALAHLVQGLRTDFPSLSVHCVAYGTTHNADLLGGIAQESQGTYAIVNTIEDTASVFGDTLGGLMSCVMQNGCVIVPEASIVHGPQKVVRENGICKIELGDVYAGTSPLILVDIPEEFVGGAECITLKGMELPDLRPWKVNPILVDAEGRQIDIELVKLRYKCTDILKTLMRWTDLADAERVIVAEDVLKFKNAVLDEVYNGNTVAEILRGEVGMLETTLERVRRGRLDVDERALASQHATTIGLGRGLSTPSAPRIQRRNAQVWSNRSYTGVEDPEETGGSDLEPTGSVPVAPQPSGFQNAVQSRLSHVLRTASQQ
jgi:hypothetical protein